MSNHIDDEAHKQTHLDASIVIDRVVPLLAMSCHCRRHVLLANRVRTVGERRHPQTRARCNIDVTPLFRNDGNEAHPRGSAAVNDRGQLREVRFQVSVAFVYNAVQKEALWTML